MGNKHSPLLGIQIPKSNTKLKRKIRQRDVVKKNKRKITPTPRSYRITFNELDILRDKAEEISQMVGSNIKITDTLILRALIRLSSKFNNSDVFEEIKLIRMEI